MFEELRLCNEMIFVAKRRQAGFVLAMRKAIFPRAKVTPGIRAKITSSLEELQHENIPSSTDPDLDGVLS